MPDRQFDFLERSALAQLQHRRLGELLHGLLPGNRFYARKLADAGLKLGDLDTVEGWQRLPFTTKAELARDQKAQPPYGTDLTFAPDRYIRFHQTSGTHGTPLRWLDTRESWEWMLNSWSQIFRMVDVAPGDRLFFPFSFGPFIGFWTAFESAQRLGCLVMPAGGMSSLARLRMLIDNHAEVMLCTPTYALHLAMVAQENEIRLGPETQGYALRKIIVAGEPGGCIPATRARIEEAFRARLFDHSGMTETGPMTCECPERPGGLHVLEADFIVEILDPTSGKPVPAGIMGELVITNLGRLGSPLLRYRTGDLVRVDPRPCPCGRSFLRLDGGILGRTDDMIPVRGNNFYPSALEGVIRRFEEVAEYRVEIDTTNPLTELRVEIEPTSAGFNGLADRIAGSIRDELLFRADVIVVPPGRLPRYEMKASRIHHKNK